ncbi:hypothetical protein [Synechococcus phage BUCT-ZZ01]|nr:hypothetical protein [Synechococcus phage BUCT-ZZ01]
MKRHVKKSEKFTSKIASKKIRVLSVTKRPDPRYDLVKIVSVEYKGGRLVAVKGTERTVFGDSIRRRYYV